MTNLAVVIPVKGQDYKSRLSRNIGPRQRKKLSMLLLTDLLETVSRAGLIGDTFVVSSSPQMLGASIRAGARSIRERRDAGVNEAVHLALARLKQYKEFMIIPSDLPLLRPEDLKRAIAIRRKGIDVVISPSSSFNGTNLLLFSRTRQVRLSYDDNSFWKHVRSAAAQRSSLSVVATLGLMQDVDTEADVKAVLDARLNRGSIAFLRECARR
jgi:2-phospho-L-lactate guanylyltransferase